MLRHQLDGAGENTINNNNYGATSTNDADADDGTCNDGNDMDTLSYTDTQGDDDDDDENDDSENDDDENESDDESETDTATGTNGTNNTGTDYTDEQSGLLSSLGGSFTRRHRRNYSNASGSLRTINTLDDIFDGGGGGNGANRARAGSFVSYSTSTLLLERTKQTLWYRFELFFPSEDDDDDAADDGTLDPWESPDVRRNYFASGNNNTNNNLYSSTTRHRIAVVFNCILLAVVYSTERASFKVLVDKAGPFRLLSAEIITALHALVLGLGMAAGKAARYFAARNKAKNGSSSNQPPQHHHRPPDTAISKGVGVPLADLGLMAVLDTAHLLLSVISGSIIPPVLTVILVQFTIPLAVYATEFLHPKGRCRKAGGVICCLGDLDEEDALGDDAFDSQGYQQSPAGAATPNRSNVGGAGGGGGGGRSSNTRSSIGCQATTAASSRPDNGNDDDVSVSSFGRLTGRHMCGAFLITIAIILVLSPAIIMIADPPSQHITSKFQETETKGVDPAIAPTRSAWNTLLFAAACIPAAASQLHKEHTLASQRQPIEPNRLNLTLSIFSSIFALIVSPLLMPLQGLSAGINWTGMYPSKETSTNFMDGLKCFAGTLDETTESTLYPESASCRFLWLVALLHVLAIIIAGVAVERIVYRGATKLIHLCISGGFVLAISAMYSYEIFDSSHIYGPIAYSSHFVAATVALIGLHMHNSEQYSAELYCSDYEKIDDLYAEEEEE